EGAVRCPGVNLSLAHYLPAVINIIGDRESTRKEVGQSAMLPEEGVALPEAYNLPTLVDADSRAEGMDQRCKVGHCAILPNESMQFSRGGSALADNLSAIINRLGCAIGSAQRPKVNDRELHGGSCPSWECQKCHNHRRNHSWDHQWRIEVGPKSAWHWFGDVRYFFGRLHAHEILLAD